MRRLSVAAVRAVHAARGNNNSLVTDERDIPSN